MRKCKILNQFFKALWAHLATGLSPGLGFWGFLAVTGSDLCDSGCPRWHNIILVFWHLPDNHKVYDVWCIWLPVWLGTQEWSELWHTILLVVPPPCRLAPTPTQVALLVVFLLQFLLVYLIIVIVPLVGHIGLCGRKLRSSISLWTTLTSPMAWCSRTRFSERRHWRSRVFMQKVLWRVCLYARLNSRTYVFLLSYVFDLYSDWHD